jgi:hypothetical protein
MSPTTSPGWTANETSVRALTVDRRDRYVFDTFVARMAGEGMGLNVEKVRRRCKAKNDQGERM